MIDLALSSDFKNLEDTVQYQLAEINDLQYFITRNLKGFKSKSVGIPVLTAEDFLKIYVG